MKKVVIDTNVIVSGLLFGGVPGRIVSLWKTKRVRTLCSGSIMEEYLRVLVYPKFVLSEDEIRYILTQEILPWLDVIEVDAGKKGKMRSSISE